MTKLVALVMGSKVSQAQRICEWVAKYPPMEIVRWVTDPIGNWGYAEVESVIDHGQADTVIVAEFPKEPWAAELREFCKAHGVMFIEAKDHPEVTAENPGSILE